jgi:hypothetical protein
MSASLPENDYLQDRQSAGVGQVEFIILFWRWCHYILQSAIAWLAQHNVD